MVLGQLGVLCWVQFTELDGTSLQEEDHRRSSIIIVPSTTEDTLSFFQMIEMAGFVVCGFCQALPTISILFIASVLRSATSQVTPFHNANTVNVIQGFLTSYQEKMKPYLFPKLGDFSRYDSCFLLFVVLFLAE